MNKQKFLDKITDLVEETLVENHASSDFTIEDLLEDEDRCAIKLTYDYSDAEYTKDVEDLFRRKKEEDVKVKDLYRNADIADEVKDFVEEQRRLRAERLEDEPDYYAEDYDLDLDDGVDDDEDYDDDYDEDEYDDDDDLESDEEKKPEVKPEKKHITFSNHPIEDGAFIEIMSGLYAVPISEDGEVISDCSKEDMRQIVDAFVESMSPQIIPVSEIFPDITSPVPMYMVTDKQNDAFGAAVIMRAQDARFADEFSSMVANETGATKFWFIPTNIGAWTAVPTGEDEIDEEYVRKIEDNIRALNKTLDEEEVLSNSLFFYDAEEKRFCKAKEELQRRRDADNQRLDLPYC